MFRLILIAAVAAILPVSSKYGVCQEPANGGPWVVDTRHSDVQVVSDATTDFGKETVSYTVGYARVNGEIRIDDADVSNSKFELHMYPADAMAPPIGKGGKNMNQYLSELPGGTLISFQSKQVTRTEDGNLQVNGELVVASVDRDVQIEPTEAYSGPTYGPPVVHRVVREASFVFDAPAKTGGAVVTNAAISLSRDNYPHLVKAVVTASWPALVRDEQCHNPAGGTEDYHGYDCTGHYLSGSGLPPAPVQIGEDYPGAWDYNHVLGNQLQLMLHLQLSPAGEGTSGGAM